jgi:hypothetical protein
VTRPCWSIPAIAAIADGLAQLLDDEDLRNVPGAGDGRVATFTATLRPRPPRPASGAERAR